MRAKGNKLAINAEL